ncbi:hypothetical protein ACS0TY_001581 [Phlomoides rotata]
MVKCRTKSTTEQLYRHVDGVWTEAEPKAKKVKVSFGIGKQELTDDKDGSNSCFGEEKQRGQQQQQTESSDNAETLFGKVKFGVASISPKVSLTLQKLKVAKPIDLVKKGYDIIKDELKGNPNRRKHLEYDGSSAASTAEIERSTRTDIIVVPSKQSRWSKKWEALKSKMQGNHIFKSVSGFSEPVIGKSQEIAEDMRNRWETSDHPVVHKTKSIETVLGESDAAMSFKEICCRDLVCGRGPEVQEVVKAVLSAYFKESIQ